MSSERDYGRGYNFLGTVKNGLKAIELAAKFTCSVTLSQTNSKMFPVSREEQLVTVKLSPVSL